MQIQKTNEKTQNSAQVHEYKTLDLEKSDEVKDLKPGVGDKHKIIFTITQDQINKFAEISGDNNPIHVDPEYIKEKHASNPKYPFKGNISHGLLAAGKFSAFYGKLLPGLDTLYTGLNIKLLSPIYPGKEYAAIFEAKEMPKDHRLVYENKIVDPELYGTNPDKPDLGVCITGTSEVYHREKIGKL
ncbi:MAG: MaoC/PaaZ C-terminal domain-containing protein [Candidatus Gastranaerophilaceae bacterium]|jgi:acyl dehydratase